MLNKKREVRIRKQERQHNLEGEKEQRYDEERIMGKEDKLNGSEKDREENYLNKEQDERWHNKESEKRMQL